MTFAFSARLAVPPGAALPHALTASAHTIKLDAAVVLPEIARIIQIASARSTESMKSLTSTWPPGLTSAALRAKHNDTPGNLELSAPPP